jgi:anti-anti-sigma factor
LRDIQHKGAETAMAFESFHYELQESPDQSGQLTTTIYCHGKLITENTADVRALISPILARGGRIILDFSDLEYLDSSGLGAIVALKVSSIHRAHGKLELVNLKPRIQKLLSLTNLLQVFADQVPTHLL